MIHNHHPECRWGVLGWFYQQAVISGQLLPETLPKAERLSLLIVNCYKIAQRIERWSLLWSCCDNTDFVAQNFAQGRKVIVAMMLTSLSQLLVIVAPSKSWYMIPIMLLILLPQSLEIVAFLEKSEFLLYNFVCNLQTITFTLIRESYRCNKEIFYYR